MNILVYQLTAAVSREAEPLPTWLQRLSTCPFKGYIERSLWGGFHADRLGYAFVAGYQSALGHLFEHARAAPGTTSGDRVVSHAGPLALAATEAGGAHPRTIATRLDKQGGALLLRGEKTFVTMAPLARELLVVATRGLGPDGKNRLRVVRIATRSHGVHVIPRSETPFAPEIPHARVTFDDAVVEPENVLPGDGYEHWLKPFRTVEDTHVLAGLVGYLSGAARAHGWSPSILTELSSLALALIDLGARDPNAPLTHVLLAGLFGHMRRLLGNLDSEWEKAGPDERGRWQRDLPLLLVAESVREMRMQAAMRSLSST